MKVMPGVIWVVGAAALVLPGLARADALSGLTDTAMGLVGGVQTAVTDQTAPLADPLTQQLGSVPLPAAPAPLGELLPVSPPSDQPPAATAPPPSPVNDQVPVPAVLPERSTLPAAAPAAGKQPPPAQRIARSRPAGSLPGAPLSLAGLLAVLSLLWTPASGGRPLPGLHRSANWPAADRERRPWRLRGYTPAAYIPAGLLEMFRRMGGRYGPRSAELITMCVPGPQQPGYGRTVRPP